MVTVVLILGALNKMFPKMQAGWYCLTIKQYQKKTEKTVKKQLNERCTYK